MTIAPNVEPARPLVVIPAWNEALCVADTITEVLTELPNVTVLVVDDGSTDRTSAVSRHAGALVIRLPFNVGVGGAMRVGFRYALDHGYDAVVQVDADGQHSATDVRTLLRGLSTHDLVVGNRFSCSAYPVSGPRRWAMSFLSNAISLLAGHEISDTTSGMRATGSRLLPLYAQCYPAEYLGDTVEALVIAIRSGFRVGQVPVTMRQRRAGIPSHSARKAAIYLVRALFVLSLSMLRRWPVPPPAPFTQGRIA